jgi:hypothetical protein
MSTPPNRPIDPAVAAAEAGRVVAERIAQRGPRRRRGRPQNPRAPPDDHHDEHGDDVDAYDISTFCRRHHISQSFYFKLQAMGLGPATMRIGKRVLISREAAKRWRNQQRTAATKKSGIPLKGTSRPDAAV